MKDNINPDVPSIHNLCKLKFKIGGQIYDESAT